MPAAARRTGADGRAVRMRRAPSCAPPQQLPPLPPCASADHGMGHPQSVRLPGSLGQGPGSGTGPILLSQATFLLAHIANSGPARFRFVSRFRFGPVPLSLSCPAFAFRPLGSARLTRIKITHRRWQAEVRGAPCRGWGGATGTSGMPLTASGRERPPDSDACKRRWGPPTF